jgi:hypothetical protein
MGECVTTGRLQINCASEESLAQKVYASSVHGFSIVSCNEPKVKTEKVHLGLVVHALV